MKTVRITPIKKLDDNQIDHINQLIQELFGTFDHFLSKTYLNHVIRSQDSKLFGAFQNKRLVGMVLVHIYQSLSRKVAVLDELVIDQAFRGQKIGEELITAAKIWAISKNTNCLECTTRAKNKAAINFFLKLGFHNRNQKAFRLNLKN